MQNELALIRLAEFDEEYFDEFRQKVKGIANLTEHQRSVGPILSYGVIATLVVLYISKIFLDEYLKRAAKDTCDATYPALKEAIFGLLRKLLFKPKEEERPYFVSSKGIRIHEGRSYVFSIVLTVSPKISIRFEFFENCTEESYRDAIEKLFLLVPDIELEMYESENNRSGIEIEMIYDPQLCVWRETTETERKQPARWKQVD